MLRSPEELDPTFTTAFNAGDTDTIAAMAGAVGGACHGLSAFPPHAVEVIDAQGLALADLADSLLALRR